MLSFHIAKEAGKLYKDAVISHLSSKGINTDGLNIEDACGLSHFNSITPIIMTQWLKYLRKQSAYSDEFFSTLPVAGTSGTLSRYCIGTKAQNRLHAKSGSMTRVRAYGGYILNSDGDEIVFCFIANNYTCNNYGMRKISENLFIEIAKISENNVYIDKVSSYRDVFEGIDYVIKNEKGEILVPVLKSVIKKIDINKEEIILIKKRLMGVEIQGE